MINKFTDPFRYTPHPLVRRAAEAVISDLDTKIREGKLPAEVCKGFQDGKMLGVLIASPANNEGQLTYLKAFSGSVGNHSTIEGFVPPIYDLLDPSGYFKKKEAEIIATNKEISELLSAEEYISLTKELTKTKEQREAEILSMRDRMAASKLERSKRRAEGCDAEVLIKESQFEKAELKRLKTLWDSRISKITETISSITYKIEELKKSRARMSDNLQEWIFRQYRVHNALGIESSVYEIFNSQGLIPPGGTGDCAAPKLLEHAYRLGLKPLAMGEFWYGTSPNTAVRTHGHFYPSCTSKCGPLLEYMLKGLELESTDSDICAPTIIHEDDWLIAVSKPSGMPSVPGLDGRLSAQEWLSKRQGSEEAEVHAVHRLDMDTSGILLFAKNTDTAIELRKQFEAHTIKKTYIARLYAENKEVQTGQNGKIALPLAPDYDERPRQKVDIRQGKEAVTEYKVISTNDDGTMDIIFHPFTGRTHQLRVHSAHHLGLGCPIVGDLLYGGHGTSDSTATRLHLHALKISFNHPVSGLITTFESTINSF